MYGLLKMEVGKIAPNTSASCGQQLDPTPPVTESHSPSNMATAATLTPTSTSDGPYQKRKRYVQTAFNEQSM